MIKRFNLFITIILTVSIFLCSCNSKSTRFSETCIFDSININLTEHLFDDTLKPACHLNLNFTYLKDCPDLNLKNTVNELFIKSTFGDSLISKIPEVAAQLYASNYLNTYKKDIEPLYLQSDTVTSQKSQSDLWLSYFENINSNIYYLNDNLLVYSVKINRYTGGAHGMYSNLFINIDLTTGKRIFMNDIFKANSDSLITEELWKQLVIDQHVTNKQVLEDLGYGQIGELKPTENFIIGQDGITFYYNVYDIAPYSEGPTQIKLSYNKLKNILRKDSVILKPFL